MEHKLEEIRRKAEECVSKNNYSGGLSFYLQIYEALSHNQNEKKEEIATVSDKCVKLMNAIAMKYIQQEMYQDAWDMLKRAEDFAGSRDSLKVSTYNNFACLYRKLNRPKAALTFLEQALNIEYKCLNMIEKDEEFTVLLIKDNPADTHLNLCAVLSLIGKHEVAYLHALKALTFLQSEIFERKSGSVPEEGFRPLADRCAVLCIAYHNLASELEFLKQMDEALQAYKKAAAFAEKFLGEKNTLTKSMKEIAKNFGDAQEKERVRKLQRQTSYSAVTYRTQSAASSQQRGKVHRTIITSGPSFMKSLYPQKSNRVKAFEDKNNVRIIIKSGKRDWLAPLSNKSPLLQ